jgi:hypothetical protein
MIISRVLAALALTIALFVTGCSGVSVGVGYNDDYYYGARRLPLNYFYYDNYYDGLIYNDYVCYDDYWYYQGYGTPYDYYWDDPYTW